MVETGDKFRTLACKTRFTSRDSSLGYYHSILSSQCSKLNPFSYHTGINYLLLLFISLSMQLVLKHYC